jgi:hypothetical protein
MCLKYIGIAGLKVWVIGSSIIQHGFIEAWGNTVGFDKTWFELVVPGKIRNVIR